jgi:hypothetical protein
MKFKLNNDILYDAFFEDTTLIGITTTLKNYKLCWQLNEYLGFNFKLNNNIEICLSKRKRKYFFDVYESNFNSNTLIHYLYHNFFDGEYLLPELKHIDFIWLMKGDTVDEEQLNNLITELKKIKGVQLVAELTNDHIKNKGNMVF